MKLRKEVLWFGRQMEAKLQEHDDDRGGWENCDNRYLQDLLMQGAEELLVACGILDDAIDRSCYSMEDVPLQQATIMHVITEAADVANFALMIADNARQIPPRLGLDVAHEDSINADDSD